MTKLRVNRPQSLATCLARRCSASVASGRLPAWVASRHHAPGGGLARPSTERTDSARSPALAAPSTTAMARG